MTKSYKLLKIECYPLQYVAILCTDIGDLETIKHFVLEKHPTAKVELPKLIQQDLMISRLEYKEKDLVWELLSYLCNKGWKPIEGDQTSVNEIYYLIFEN